MRSEEFTNAKWTTDGELLRRAFLSGVAFGFGTATAIWLLLLFGVFQCSF